MVAGVLHQQDGFDVKTEIDETDGSRTMKVQHVFIIGSKGMGNYGGYETFVDKLTEYYQNNQYIKYHIVCKENGQGAMDEKKLIGAQIVDKSHFVYHNASCVKIHVPEKLGSAQAIYYDVEALKESISCCKKYNIEHPILSTANTLQLSKASVTSYLPYKKGVYFPSTADKEKISVGAERQRRYRAVKRWRDDPTEENFWGVVLAYAGVRFKTYSGLPFSYEIKKGRNGQYKKELWIDRKRWAIFEA